jgi:predicted DNA-binding transcriptional regulator AlpA
MSVIIDGTRYFSAGEIEKQLCVSRTTFWRWRTDEEVPAGSKLRGRKLLFTEDEFAEIRAYANRLEPA